jgi:hypothetical protein
VPLAASRVDGDTLVVDASKDEVTSAPSVEGDDHISETPPEPRAIRAAESRPAGYGRTTGTLGGVMEQQDGAGGVANVAKEQAGQVGQAASAAGGQVAQATKEQAGAVAGEVRQQARDLVGEARTQVGDQASTQKGRAVEGLRSLGDELQEMAQQGGRSGVATEVARQAASRAHGLADHLDRHEPAELLDQARSYARRRPVVFLAGAAVLGVVAGRLTRNLASSGDSGDSEPAALTGPASTPALPAASGYPDAPGYPARAVEPAYPSNGYEAGGYPADPSAAGGEPGPAGYPAGSEPAGGFRSPGEPVPAGGAYEPAYGSGLPQPGYEPGYEPGPDQAGLDDGSATTGPTGYGTPAATGQDAGYQPGIGYEPGQEPVPENWRGRSS